MTEKKRRLGRVAINTGYVVDLDNEAMVEQAKDALFEDVMNAVKYNEIGTWIKIEREEDLRENSPLKKEDIPTFLIEDTEEENTGNEENTKEE